MRVVCSAGLSTAPDLGRALEEVCEEAGIVGADLAFVFVSAAHEGARDRVGREVQRRLGPRAFLGCTVQGAIAGRTEVETGPSVALWNASRPGARIDTFHATTGPGGRLSGLPDVGEDDTVLLIADPFSTPLVEALEQFPAGATVLGGVASGATTPKHNSLFRNAETHAEGCVGTILSGIDVRAVVSQGCRPVGRPFVVTKAQENILLGLAGKPALERLREVVASLPGSDRELAHGGLQLGCAIDEYKDRHGHGDFLIRNVAGVDAQSGALAITDYMRVGQTVQFHVRDGASAQEELRRLLGGVPATPRGALLFACNGRGTHMFQEPHVDAMTAWDALGGVPQAGFFAGGEIGPVGGKNYLHGFTASVAVFCESG